MIRLISIGFCVLSAQLALAVCPTSPMQSAIYDFAGQLERLKIENVNGGYAKTCYYVGIASEQARAVGKAIFFEPKTSSADTWIFEQQLENVHMTLDEMSDICTNQSVATKVDELKQVSVSTQLATAKLLNALKSECSVNAGH